MNSKELIDCFDAITPTKEQKDKMLNAILENMNTPVRVYKFHRFATAAAAVIAIGIFAVVYPNIKDDVTVQRGGNTDVAYIEPAEIEESEDAGSGEDRAVKPDMPVQSKKNEVSDVKTNDNQSVKSTEDSSASSMISEEYHDDINDGGAEKFADASVNNYDYARSADTSEDAAVSKESVQDEVALAEDFDMSYSAALGSSGGGGLDMSAYPGAPAGAYNSFAYMTLDDIMSDSVYSGLFPKTILDGFVFSYAGIYSDTLEAYFYSDDGYMSIFAVNESDYGFAEQVVSPDAIKKMKAKDGRMDFAVKCGRYYVVYSIETEDFSEVYKMVTSSKYFKK